MVVLQVSWIDFFLLVLIVYFSNQLIERSKNQSINDQYENPIPISSSVSYSHDKFVKSLIESLEIESRKERREAEDEEGRRKRETKEAWVLLLDGDDQSNHYSQAALAHTRSLRSYDQRDVVILIKDLEWQRFDSLRGQLREAGAVIKKVNDLSNRIETAITIKHINKIYIWTLEEYSKIVFIDLDMALLRPWILSNLLFNYPGDPPTFNVNYERADRFNSGLMIVKPSLSIFNELANSLKTYESSWDTTDQSFIHQKFKSFTRLPSFICPKKRIIYTNPDIWESIVSKESNESNRFPFRLSCFHWTGEKPWKFQKRNDLASFSLLWHFYLNKWIDSYRVPSSDFESKKFQKKLNKL